MLTEQQLEQLFTPLNATRVSTKEGKFKYLETWDVLAHLGRIFGPDNWDSETKVDLVFESERLNSGQPTGRWDVAYKGWTRLIIRDPDGGLVCVKEGVATGSAENQRRVDAHDLALKSASSDSLKRAAIGLGNQFGLSLYDGGGTHSVLGRSLAHTDIGKADWLAAAESLGKKLDAA